MNTQTAAGARLLGEPVAALVCLGRIDSGLRMGDPKLGEQVQESFGSS
jgi:hypothetical protein